MRAMTILCAVSFGLMACHKNEELQPGQTKAEEHKPPPLTTANLRTIWGSGPSDVWVAGDKGTILHYNGQAWSISPSGTQENLTSLYGTAPNNIWVSGEKGAILLWDGAAWKEVSNGVDTVLVNMWASGPTDVWAVGVDMTGESAYIRRWNGTKWEGQDIPGSSSLWGVTGTGPEDVWLVGNNQGGEGVVLHGNGKHFDAIGYKGPPARAVWCAAPKDVWVAPGQGSIQHWDGATWKETASQGSWFRLGGSGADDVWAAGLDGVTLHFHGGNWTPQPTGAKQIIWSIWAPTPGAAWAVGNGGTLLRWDGSAWVK
jgi:hypothetical protein